MSLTAGTKLGPYEILSPAGAGGMGEVYRARDTRLQRTVAVKVLPSHLSSNPELRQRFEREARAISSLQHPHICTLHDIGRQGGIDYLVLEYLEGETLAARLQKGPLPLDQLLKIAVEIAGALDKAHRQGILHRDLKPGNIILTKSGAKLTDFGLAKPSRAALPDKDGLTLSKTPLTAEGRLVGTFQYMAPEQLEGKEADARSDIFSLGCVLYEMATGRLAFDGKSPISVLAAILEKQPEPLRKLKPMTPPALEHIVSSCLAKNPDDRFQTAHDIKLELEWILQSGAAPIAASKRRNPAMWALVALAALLIGALGTASFVWRPHAYAYSVRSAIEPPPKTQFHFAGDLGGPATVSPDGRLLAFSARDENSRHMLWVRPLDSLVAAPLAGTEDAYYPFWSPDSRSLGFFARGKLKRIDIAGGAPIDLADATTGRGGTWNQSNTILFVPNAFEVVYSLSASGGTPKPVTKLDKARHSSHRWPSFLPDGNHFVYLAVSHTSGAHENDELRVGALDGSVDERIVSTHANAQFASGHLLYMRDRSLVAQVFDPSKLQLAGAPEVLADSVEYQPGWWNAVFSASHNGVLAYSAASGPGGTNLEMLDRDGKVHSKLAEHDWFNNLALSADGEKLLVVVGQPSSDLWIYDLAHSSKRRLTFKPSGQVQAVWSPDGKEAFFSATRVQPKLLRKAISGIGEEQPLLTIPGRQALIAISHDGRYLAYMQADPGKSRGPLCILPLQGDRQPFTFIPEGEFVDAAEFSPDDHWVIYTSPESGHVDVYATDFPKHQGKWQISTGGGGQPRWSRDGKEIFYMTYNGDLMAVPVNTHSGTIETGEPKRLFHVNLPPVLTFDSRFYAVTPDSKHFVAITAGDETEHEEVVLVTNWDAKLK